MPHYGIELCMPGFFVSLRHRDGDGIFYRVAHGVGGIKKNACQSRLLRHAHHHARTHHHLNAQIGEFLNAVGDIAGGFVGAKRQPDTKKLSESAQFRRHGAVQHHGYAAGYAFSIAQRSHQVITPDLDHHDRNRQVTTQIGTVGARGHHHVTGLLRRLIEQVDHSFVKRQVGDLDARARGEVRADRAKGVDQSVTAYGPDDGTSR